MWATLGSITFELMRSPESADLATKHSYAEHAVIEGKPKLQWVGDALKERTWTIRLHRVFCDPDAVLAAIRDMAASHAAQPLSLGTGTYLGRYVVLDITENTIMTDPSGATWAVAATLKLKEWSGQESAATTGEAVSTPSQPVVAGTIGLSETAKAKLESAPSEPDKPSSSGQFSFSEAEKEMGL